MQKILLTGAKPTGELHLGVYFGMMKPALELTKSHSSNYIFIPDLHSLTSVTDGALLKEQIYHVAAGYLAAGFDKDNVVMFQQSKVPAHTELTWIFDCLTTMPYLMRAHAFKDAEAKNKEINVGVFNYPMLMAADILLYDTDTVPVGKDQKQHVEYARDTALKFNNAYGEVFKLPEPHIVESLATVPGIDGQKMSKSYKNVIPLFGTAEAVQKQIMSIVTDSKGADEPKDPDTCNVFALHKLFATEEELAELRDRYVNGSISYKESKELLFTRAEVLLKPMREKYEHYINNKEEIKKVLDKGAEIAREKTENKMKKVREMIGVTI